MNKTTFWALISTALLSATASATQLRFIPTEVEMKTKKFSSFADNRFLKVNGLGEIIYQDADGNVSVWRQDGVLRLNDCKQAPAEVYISNDGSRAIYECADQHTFAVNINAEGFTRHLIHTVGAGISKNSFDPAIAAKNGRVLNMKPHVTSSPRQGEARIVTSVGNDAAYQNYRLSYFDRPELGRVRVKGFSPNGRYALLNGIEQRKFVMDLTDQSYRELRTIDANFSHFALVSNDGSNVVSHQTNNSTWYCQQSLAIWRENADKQEIAFKNPEASTEAACLSAQDMSASGSVVLALSHRYLQQPTGFIWTRKTNELIAFEAFITQHGGQLSAWSNLIPLSISEDGLYIAGIGTDPEGNTHRVFLVEIDPVAQCDVNY